MNRGESDHIYFVVLLETMPIQVTSTDHHASEGVVHTLDKVSNFDALDLYNDNHAGDDHDDDHVNMMSTLVIVMMKMFIRLCSLPKPPFLILFSLTGSFFV